MKKFRPNLAAMVAIAALAATAVSCSNNDVVGNDGDGNTGGGGSTVSNIQASSLADFCIYSTRSAVFSSTLADDKVVTTAFKKSKVQDMENKTGTDELGKAFKDFDATYKNSWDNRPQKSNDRGGDNADEFVSKAECEYVLAYLKNHKNEGWTNIDIATYYIQYVGGSKQTYTTTKDQNGATETVTSSGHMDQIWFGTQHINDYNTSGGPREFIQGLNLKDNTPSYWDSWGGSRQYNHYKYYYIEYNKQKNLYLCFDYAPEKSGSNQTVVGDGIYDDYVIKIIAASADESQPGVPDTTPDPIPTPDVKPIPGTPEVQIDLNVKDDQHQNTDSAYARNETKLSIHVRDTVDVEVYIPIAKEYYCDKDDMFIVERHQEGYWVYNGDNTNQEIVSMKIADDNITLTVSYETKGIRIKTKGIGANALKYCRQAFGDGITFEVSNYFTGFANASALLETLKNAKPTVKFYNTDGSPISGYKYYDKNALIDDAKDIVVEQAE